MVERVGVDLGDFAPAGAGGAVVVPFHLGFLGLLALGLNKLSDLVFVHQGSMKNKKIINKR